jgi:uncharacterized protein (DUF1501 family)
MPILDIPAPRPIITRRTFLKGTAAAGVATVALPTLRSTVALAAPGGSYTGDVVVNVFARGGMDGLGAFPPIDAAHGADQYKTARPTTYVDPADAINLGNGFGMHPALSALKPLWDAGHLAVVHAVGYPLDNRSHFSSQVFIDSGTGGTDLTSGWIARHFDTLADGNTGLRGVGLPHAEGSLAEAPSSVSMGDIGSFRINGVPNNANTAAKTALTALYAASTASPLLSGQTAQVLASLDLVTTSAAATLAAQNASLYPKNDYFGYCMSQIGGLIKAGVGLEASATDAGYGWDLHSNYGTTASGNMHDNLLGLGNVLAAFYNDLGPTLMAKTTIVVMTEFGRTFRENSSLGLDHGRGSVMLVLGGAVKGGQVLGTWPSLDPATIDSVGDALPVTLDYRYVLAEIVEKRLLNSNLTGVFPDFTLDPTKRLNLFGP